MSELLQTRASRFASFKAFVLRSRPRIVPDRMVLARDQRPFPQALTGPTLPASIRDEVMELYAFIFCRGGFRQLEITFEQFLLVIAAVKPADLPATRAEPRTL
jgi:hypothetical protein